MVEIRGFKYEDFESISEFVLQAHKRESNYNPHLKTDREAHTFLQAWLSESISTGGKILIAEAEGEAIGFAWGWIIHKPPELFKVDHIGYIYQVYVKDEGKREIKEKLLTELIKYFKSKGIEYIITDCYTNDEETVRLYEKMGFKPQALTLIRRIEQ